MPANDANFLIWFGAGESQFAPVLPRPFVREPEMVSPVVWLVPGETIGIYINTINNTPMTGVMKFLHEKTGTVEQPLFQDLTAITFPGGGHIYGTLTVPGGFPEGLCQLKLGTYATQYLWMSTAEKAADRTAIVEFRSEDRMGGAINTRWRYVSAGWKQRFRIRLAVDNVEPNTNKSTYRTSTTGATRPYYSEQQRIVKFLTTEYNYWGHQAVAAMLEHDTILINGLPFVFNEPYVSNINRGDVLSEGTFSMIDEQASTIRRT